MAPDLNQSVSPLPYPPIDEQRTRLWALSYERKTKVVCCENCGATTAVTRLMADPDAVPLRRVADASGQEPGSDKENKREHCTGRCTRENSSGDSAGNCAGNRCIDNRYDIVSTLGQGGMGSVYLVHDKVLDKPMAIKMLRQDLLSKGSRTHAKRFAQEARSALEMTHVNVVAAYSQGKDKSGAPYLVMDFIEGESLAALIERQGAVEIRHALNIFTQVCEALTHAHTKNLIHRDIKPANLLLQPIGGGGVLVKLVDFGIAKTLPLFHEETRALTRTGEILGSPAYMSPEQCLGDEADERSDIYALGCVMYEALTGRTPFTTRHPIITLMQHVEALPASLARKIRIEEHPLMDKDFDIGRYRQAVDNVVLRCLAKQPAQRYQSADALRLDLEGLSHYSAPALRRLSSMQCLSHDDQCAEKISLTEEFSPTDENLSKKQDLLETTWAKTGRIEAKVALIALVLGLIALGLSRAF